MDWLDMIRIKEKHDLTFEKFGYMAGTSRQMIQKIIYEKMKVPDRLEENIKYLDSLTTEDLYKIYKKKKSISKHNSRTRTRTKEEIEFNNKFSPCSNELYYLYYPKEIPVLDGEKTVYRESHTNGSSFDRTSISSGSSSLMYEYITNLTNSKNRTRDE